MDGAIADDGGTDEGDTQQAREQERLRQVIRKLEHNFIDVLQRDPVDPHRAGDRANPRPRIRSTGYDV